MQDVSIPSRLSIGQYLINRLIDYGIKDLFGIPGDYILSFYGMLEQSPINVVGCTREDNAGFAADAYARLNGLGALCVTYCVGGLSVCNSIAGAFAEKSPVVLISGAPGLNERVNNPLLHHKVREFRTQFEVFDKLCIAACELKDANTAFAEIDRVLDAATRYKRPVYIELPRDMVNVVPTNPYQFEFARVEPDPASLAEAIRESVLRLKSAARPMILAGVEIHRFGLQDLVIQLAEKMRIPIAATILGKSVVGETHPLYVGLYEGALGESQVTQYVEQSDCLLMLGTFMTDINLGINTANLNVQNCIYATSEQFRISHHYYQHIPLEQYLNGLLQQDLPICNRPVPPRLPHIENVEEKIEPDAPLRISKIIKLVNEKLTANNIVIADIGDSLFASLELVVHERTDFISPAYYTSMGFSVPATLGACVARPRERVITICGDGAFQMTGTELSTIVRYGYAPIVIILDNHGYGTERFLHAGDWKFNEIHSWRYSLLPEIYGSGKGYYVADESAFAQAFNDAISDNSCVQIIHAKIAEGDASQTLLRLAERMSKTV
jgi:indolepyruvate decarboxylase